MRPGAENSGGPNWVKKSQDTSSARHEFGDWRYQPPKCCHPDLAKGNASMTVSLSGPTFLKVVLVIRLDPSESGLYCGQKHLPSVSWFSQQLCISILAWDVQASLRSKVS